MTKPNPQLNQNIKTVAQLFKSVRTLCVTIEQLLQDASGADIEAFIDSYTPEGDTILLEALNTRSAMKAIIELLFNLGADPEKPKLHFISKTSPETPLSCAALGKDLAMIDLIHKEIKYKYDFLYNTGQIATNQPANISVNESVAPNNINLKDLAQKLQPKTPASPKPSKPIALPTSPVAPANSNIINLKDYKDNINKNPK